MARKSGCFLVITLILSVSRLWAGDYASFVDLGFSPDGSIYMFGQYGVRYQTWQPWAELFVVDVPRNDFVTGGRISYSHDQPIPAGQDGAGALYRLIARNTALADKYGINFMRQGQPLYIALENGSIAGESIGFRDFASGASYTARLIPRVEGAGEDIKSSFYINVERTEWDGSLKSYTVGTPEIKRPLVEGYRIKKVIVAPHDGSLIFVIEMTRRGEEGVDIRYMVEALRL
jgi:predicted secreted protein